MSVTSNQAAETKSFNIVVRNIDGWWAAVCTELSVSGFGRTKEEAVESVARSMRSSLAATVNMLKQDLVNVHRFAEVKQAVKRAPAHTHAHR